jgi:5-methylcytosine-specific restriction endonuclease McrA
MPQDPDVKRAKHAAYMRRYYAQHSKAFNASAASYRARKKAAPINDLTAAQWQAIKAHYGHRCVYCGTKSQRLTQDHLTPLSKEGAHTLSNVVPACRSCNSRKFTGPVLKPVQPLLI